MVYRKTSGSSSSSVRPHPDIVTRFIFDKLVEESANVIGVIDDGTAVFKKRSATSPYKLSSLYLGVYIACRYNNEDRCESDIQMSRRNFEAGDAKNQIHTEESLPSRSKLWVICI